MRDSQFGLRPHRLSRDRSFEVMIHLLNINQYETAACRVEFVRLFENPVTKKRLDVKSIELRKGRLYLK